METKPQVTYSCPNCVNIADVPYCSRLGIFTPNPTVQDSCQKQQQGQTPITYKQLREKWFPKKPKEA